MMALETLLSDTIRPNRLHELKWLMQYMKEGSKAGAPLFLSLGETWEQIPDKLVQIAAAAPKYVHGYHLAMAGYPPLRRKAQKLLEHDYRLRPEWHGADIYDTAICATGTRAVMFDFARLLATAHAAGRKPVIIASAPAWDYSGVFSAAGFTPHYIPLLPENGFAPDSRGIIHAIENLTADKTLFPVFALNAQHNPTAINWPELLVAEVVDTLIAHDVPLLIDDAYFAITAPNVTPTSAMHLLLQRVAQRPDYVWLLTRSLGKQFSCNGWGVGIVAGPPALLEELFNTWQIQHHYNINGLFQYAMSEWLNMPEAAEYTYQQRTNIHGNRLFFLEELESELGYPCSESPSGECTSFQLFPIPRRYAGRACAFIQDCVALTGVLFTDSYPLPYNCDGEISPSYFARVFLAGKREDLSDAILRMKKGGFYFDV